METVRCCEHPARVNEAATAQEVVHAPYVLEDASYPRLRLNLCLPSTNYLEVLADAPLTTHRPCEKKNFVQMFLQINSNLVLLKIKLKNQTPVVLKLILLTTLLYVARGFLNGRSPFGVTPGSVPSIWVSKR